MGVKLSKLKEVKDTVWVDYYPGGFDSEDAVMSFEIRCMRSPLVIKRNRQLMVTDGNRTRTPKQLETITIKLLAETVLQDWRGLLDDDDNEIRFSPENAIAVLTEYREIADFLSDEAYKLENFRKVEDLGDIDEEEDVIKNLKSA